MNTRQSDQELWPTSQQELLLRAALLRGKDAIQAWDEWASSADIGRLGAGSVGLLPLLYRNLLDHGVSNPLMNTLKGVYRLTWYKNQISLHKLASMLRLFEQAGMQTMILKGAALTLLHYQDFGLRGMGDVDVLVHTRHASPAINLLTERGWKPKVRPLQAFTEEYFYLSQSDAFGDGAGTEFDLHWHVLLECCYTGADDDFWDTAVSTQVRTAPTNAMNPTDQLLHVCIHGMRWHGQAPLIWIADAMTILNSSQTEIDWDRLLTQAQKRRLIVPLRHALSYLRGLLAAPIPLALLQGMQQLPVSRFEIMEYGSRGGLSELAGPLHKLRFWYLRYARVASSGSLKGRRIGFPRYLQHVWNVDHLWQVPFYAVSGAVRSVCRMAASLGRQLASNSFPR